MRQVLRSLLYATLETLYCVLGVMNFLFVWEINFDVNGLEKGLRDTVLALACMVETELHLLGSLAY